MNQAAPPLPASSARPLRLEPLRALRYDPDRVGDLAAATCPPYDVVGDQVAAWESAHENNVVRLILPHDGDDGSRYRHAARDLHAWLANGLLRRDAEPALYVYRQEDQTTTSVGLVGALSLHDLADRRVLPHEEVFPGPVADRAALMRATRAQFEPILLTYEGDGPASDAVEAAMSAPAELVMETGAGTTHQLWRIADPDLLATVRSDLMHRQALIADGHHRYAAYLSVRNALGRTVPGASFGLAMLVDARRHPLRLGSVHRSVAHLSLDDVIEPARRVFTRVHALPEGPVGTVVAAMTATAEPGPGPVYVLGDGRQWLLLASPRRALVDTTMPNTRSALWRRLDASILCSVVLPLVLGVDDADQRVAYHHEPDDASRRAARTRGIALLVNPPAQEDVLAVAAGGERMPRKSTSFGPKPRTGLVMRLLTDSPTAGPW